MTELIVKVDDDFLEQAKIAGMESQYELIRCKDCIEYIPNRHPNESDMPGRCMYDGRLFYCTDDDFCNNGQKGKSSWWWMD